MWCLLWKRSKLFIDRWYGRNFWKNDWGRCDCFSDFSLFLYYECVNENYDW